MGGEGGGGYCVSAAFCKKKWKSLSIKGVCAQYNHKLDENNRTGETLKYFFFFLLFLNAGLLVEYFHSVVVILLLELRM